MREKMIDIARLLETIAESADVDLFTPRQILQTIAACIYKELGAPGVTCNYCGAQFPEPHKPGHGCI